MSKPSQATQIVDLGSSYAYFVSPDGQPFVQFPAGDHLETWPVRSQRFKLHLAWRFHRETGIAPGSDGVRSALSVLEGEAHRGPIEPVFTRVGYDEARRTVYLDLCNSDWEAVAINSTGWSVVPSEAVPIYLRRGRAMLALPEPAVDGSVEELGQLINVNEEDLILIVGFLLGAFRPTGPYPNLELHGEQDAGKSKATLFIRDLIDPHKLKLRAQPKDIRDLAVATENTWCVAFDNLSHIPTWFSDALCRLSTGGGISFRQLYTDDEERIFEGMRPVVMNGINELAVRGDLLDRSVQVTLKPIAETKRISERELFRRFLAARPRILGGLLNAVSAALANESATTLNESPRLMDWAIWVTAAEPELPGNPEDFLSAYQANRRAANQAVLDHDVVATPIVEFMRMRDTWSGTATDLLRALEEMVQSQPGGVDRLRRLQHQQTSGWPSDGTRMGRALRRLAPVLRRSGIHITEPPERARPRNWTVEVRSSASGASKRPDPSRADTGCVPEPEGAKSVGEDPAENQAHDATDTTDADFLSPEVADCYSGADSGDEFGLAPLSDPFEELER